MEQFAFKAQKNEITEHFIYLKLAAGMKDIHNRQVLEHIAADELKHYGFWKKHTHKDVKPNWFIVWWYVIISKILGLTFGIKLMEHGEKGAQSNYGKQSVPGISNIIKDEHKHERQLIEMIHEEKLQYIGSIVLGLNDALVELTGALAGLTFALSNGRIVALAGMITGIAASLSMAASEFQSRRSEKEEISKALKASTYTGIAYIITVILLILPFLLLKNVFVALPITLGIAVLIILMFTFYTSVAQDLPFKRRFVEMVFISLGVALLSFGIGFLVKIWWDVGV